ncbi:CHAP domain-containing protein [Candidatus Saccharibacteria bacterium]|nr:CHAP domain-containing protein [Candidatus Saccharibacteria bacterium]
MRKSKTNTMTIKLFCLFAVATLGFAAFFFYNSVTQTDARTLSQVEREMADLESRIAHYEQSVLNLQSQSATLNSEISRLRTEESAFQAMIDLNQMKYDNLVAEITANEIRIQNNRDALGLVLADRHLARQTTLIERIAGSRSFSDFVDTEARATAASDSLVDTVREIQYLTTVLEGQREEAEHLIEQQTAQRNLLAANRAEHQTLLAQTQGEEAAFQRLRQGADVERERLQEEMRILMQSVAGVPDGNLAGFAFRNHTGEQGCRNYPASMAGLFNTRFGCNYRLDAGIDLWALFNRQCVSYTAWRVHQNGQHITSFGGQGHARQWPETSLAMGAVVNHTPAVGAIAVVRSGAFATFGHTMYVEAILDDGWVRVSQFNWDWTGQYSRMDIRADSVLYIHFRAR